MKTKSPNELRESFQNSFEKYILGGTGYGVHTGKHWTERNENPISLSRKILHVNVCNPEKIHDSCFKFKIHMWNDEPDFMFIIIRPESMTKLIRDVLGRGCKLINEMIDFHHQEYFLVFLSSDNRYFHFSFTPTKFNSSDNESNINFTEPTSSST